MTKPKQWLFDNGHIADPTQRGRLSRENIALIEAAVRDGAQIDGYAVSTATPKTESEPQKVDRVKVSTSTVADIGEEIRSEHAWEAHTFVDGKKVPIGMRQVCNTCGNSLTYCYCRTSVVNHGDTTALVSFVARTKPFVRSW